MATETLEILSTKVDNIEKILRELSVTLKEVEQFRWKAYGAIGVLGVVITVLTIVFTSQLAGIQSDRNGLNDYKVSVAKEMAVSEADIKSIARDLETLKIDTNSSSKAIQELEVRVDHIEQVIANWKR